MSRKRAAGLSVQLLPFIRRKDCFTASSSKCALHIPRMQIEGAIVVRREQRCARVRARQEPRGAWRFERRGPV